MGKCEKCKLLEMVFSANCIKNSYEYWLMTELFVYLHNGKCYHEQDVYRKINNEDTVEGRRGQEVLPEIKKVSENKYDIYKYRHDDGKSFVYIDKSLKEGETQEIIKYLNNHYVIGWSPFWIKDEIEK